MIPCVSGMGLLLVSLHALHISYGRPNSKKRSHGRLKRDISSDHEASASDCGWCCQMFAPVNLVWRPPNSVVLYQYLVVGVLSKSKCHPVPTVTLSLPSDRTASIQSPIVILLITVLIRACSPALFLIVIFLSGQDRLGSGTSLLRTWRPRSSE